MELQENVLQHTAAYDYDAFTARDVHAALSKDALDVQDFGALLSPAALPLLETIARRAQADTRRYFGNSVTLYTPLYISNYCDNYCTYCGFNCGNDIKRGKLTLDEIERELRAIANTGLEEILLLTGESREKSGVAYIGEAVEAARKHFRTIGLEVYPLNVDEYAYLHERGADFVSIYQETYDRTLYSACHPHNSPKSDFAYRFAGQERAILGGMRGVSFGALLGLGNFRKDAFAAGVHACKLQRKYPHAEISFSVPRIRAAHNKSASELIANAVSESELLQVLLAYRVFLPFASINISTRERAGFRDNVIGLVANKISSGVKVTVGGHDDEQKGDPQFSIYDERDVKTIHSAILDRRLQPVYNDYIFS
ncbi:MAG: 2-iminoacetate synthase ThiH [Oscillospiraceae bacterium]|nr:2-iminoacetate synthase ThiH [Oscillospiraceae bacterium]